MKRKFCSLVLFVVAFSASADISGRIVRVLDGDTVEILDPGNRLTRVRLAGIDAPEKSQPLVSVHVRNSHRWWLSGP